MKPVSFFASSDVVVIDRDPEMADYSNPRGEIHGFASFVYAEDVHGNRRRLWVHSSRIEKEAMQLAESLALSLQVRLNSLGKLPVGWDNWQDARPAYGSIAYQQYGQDDDLELERREADEEPWGW